MGDQITKSNVNKFQTLDDTNYSGASELWAIEASLGNYNLKLVNKLSSFFHNCSNVLEFGAGIGTLARLWELHTGVKPQCLEIDQNLSRVVKERGFICYDNLDSIPCKLDGIYTSNVLEHIVDDELILSKLHSKLNERGVIAVYVPAFMCLYSSMDMAVGHYRRYNSKELCRKLETAGFKVTHRSYSDSIGFFIWWYLKMCGSSEGAELSNNQALTAYDKFIYPISSIFDALGLKYFLGKNLLVVAEKRG